MNRPPRDTRGREIPAGHKPDWLLEDLPDEPRCAVCGFKYICSNCGEGCNMQGSGHYDVATDSYVCVRAES